MGLREIAENDLGMILGDTNGFGWAIVIIDPSEVSYSRTGFSNDISQVIDPDTGQAVSGRRASVAIRISDLPELPVAIANTASKPWIVKFNDINGNNFTFKVIESNPDRALGVVTCLLEFYE